MALNTVFLKKNIVFIKPEISNFRNIDELVEEIKIYVSKNTCNNIILDLSEYNFLNSVRVGIIIATYHFVEFVSGKIYLIVQDKQSKKMIENLSLSNTTVIFNESQLALENIA